MNYPENPNPESQKPSDEELFTSPEYLAHLAFRGLDRVLTDWMSVHPTVSADDVERARELFETTLELRRQNEPPQE